MGRKTAGWHLKEGGGRKEASAVEGHGRVKSEGNKPAEHTTLLTWRGAGLIVLNNQTAALLETHAECD